jgi:hypothetical protein
MFGDICSVDAYYEDISSKEGNVCPDMDKTTVKEPDGGKFARCETIMQKWEQRGKTGDKNVMG